MIKADKTAVGTKIGLLKAKFYLKRYFSRVYIRPSMTELDADLPILLAINHPGYMDTKVALFLVEEILERDHYLMAAVRSINNRPELRKSGAFGVDADGAIAISQALYYGAELLREQSNRCLVVFPQGDYVRSTERPISIYPGVAQIARFVKNVIILPVALHYDMFINKQPEIFIRIGEPISFRGDVPSVQTLTELVRQNMEQELDALQADIYKYELDGYEVVLKRFMGSLREGFSRRRKDKRKENIV